MKNYAGYSDKDDVIEAELIEAGIPAARLPEILRKNRGEVETIVIGDLHGWEFTRAWRYWIAHGPGIDVETAERLHATHGQVVRVAGHCGCPSPREWYKGFACGHYHVDTQEGLNALAAVLNEVATRSDNNTQEGCKIIEALRSFMNTDDPEISIAELDWAREADEYLLRMKYEKE